MAKKKIDSTTTETQIKQSAAEITEITPGQVSSESQVPNESTSGQQSGGNSEISMPASNQQTAGSNQAQQRTTGSEQIQPPQADQIQPDEQPDQDGGREKSDQDKSRERRKKETEGDEGERPNQPESTPEGETAPKEGAASEAGEGAGVGEGAATGEAGGLGAENAAVNAPRAAGAGGTTGLGAEGAAGATTGAATGTEAVGAGAATGIGASAVEGEAITTTTAATGGSCWVVALIVLVVILILTIIIFGMIACNATKGYFGKSLPVPAGKDYANSKAILAANETGAKTPQGDDINGHRVLELNDTDKKFIEDGLIDKRLADALKYLSERHLSLKISHILEGYKDLDNDPESGADRDSNIVSNNSAHKEGLAADISEIDFVYKVDEERQYCKQALATACGAVSAGVLYQPCMDFANQIKLGDLVYYSDKSENLDNSTGGEGLDAETINTKIDFQQELLNQAKLAAECLI